MKKIFLLAAAVCALFISGCGYRVGSLMHPQIKSIAIAPVSNDTMLYNVSAQMRGALAECFQTDGSLKVAGEGTVDCAVGSRDILTDGECTYRLSVHADSCYASGSLMDFWNGTLGDRGELFMGPCAKLYRRSLLVEHNIRFDESLSYAEDKLFVYTFLRHIASAAACSSVIYLYDHRQGTLSGGKMTDHRASQLLEAIPKIAAAFMELAGRFERAECFLKIYHNDIVCGNVIRVLRYFMKSRTALLTGEALCSLYSVMDRDVRLKFGERQVPGQLIAVALYKRCGVAAALYIYRHISFVLSRFYV